MSWCIQFSLLLNQCTVEPLADKVVHTHVLDSISAHVFPPKPLQRRVNVTRISICVKLMCITEPSVQSMIQYIIE